MPGIGSLDALRLDFAHPRISISGSTPLLPFSDAFLQHGCPPTFNITHVVSSSAQSRVAAASRPWPSLSSGILLIELLTPTEYEARDASRSEASSALEATCARGLGELRAEYAGQLHSLQSSLDSSLAEGALQKALLDTCKSDLKSYKQLLSGCNATLTQCKEALNVDSDTLTTLQASLNSRTAEKKICTDLLTACQSKPPCILFYDVSLPKGGRSYAEKIFTRPLTAARQIGQVGGFC